MIVNDAATLLRTAGLRRTPARAALLNVLMRADRPLTVHDLLAQLSPTPDLVTVYRSLSTLCGRNLVRKVHGEDRTWRYEFIGSDRSPHTHAHFVCDDCGQMECLPDVKLPRMPDHVTPAGKRGAYDVQTQELILRGRCPRCQS